MDKYEYKLKAEHIRKLVAKKDLVTAIKICDSIDWDRVKDVKMLTMVSEIYEASGRYDEAIDTLLQAYEYAPIGVKGALKIYIMKKANKWCPKGTKRRTVLKKLFGRFIK